MNKKLLGLLTAGLICGLSCFNSVAQETAETEPEDVFNVFISQDGIVSIDIPAVYESWMITEDSGSHFVLEDGSSRITVDHFAQGEPLPGVETSDKEYAEVTQVFHSDANEVFVITGYAGSYAEAEEVKDAVLSFKVLRYGTKTALKTDEGTAAKQTQPIQTSLDPGLTVEPVSEVLYCTYPGGVYVRSGCSTARQILGAYNYGERAIVTGHVLSEGNDYGWLQVNYQGITGYTFAKYYSVNQPDAAVIQPVPTSYYYYVPDIYYYPYYYVMDDSGELILENPIVIEPALVSYDDVVVTDETVTVTEDTEIEELAAPSSSGETAQAAAATVSSSSESSASEASSSESSSSSETSSASSSETSSSSSSESADTAVIEGVADQPAEETDAPQTEAPTDAGNS